MSGTYQRPPGTNDWWGEDAVRRRWIVEQARGLFEAAGFGEIVTPTFEDTRVFARTSGEESDVVKKEMYTFTDRGDRSLTLRPEGTAGVIRAYIEDGMSRQPQPVKLWYLAPMFRYNRVQRGRFREHYQFGVEVVGSEDPAVDAEVIGLQHRWYRRVGARAVELQLNSIGDAKCRPAYIELLVAFLDEHIDELCDECRERRHTNPLRVLDCKRESCQSVLSQAPKITDHLCEECAAHFAAARGYLDARDVPYRLDHTLVRGLDYYTRTAWEFVSGELGAQATIGGGGRYDGLAEELGGPPTPGIGFGSGVERVAEVAGELPAPDRGWTAFAILTAEAAPRLHALMDEAREHGVHCEAAFGGRSVRRILEWASKRDAERVVIAGEDEWSRGEVAVRDMTSGDQRTVPLDGLLEELIG
ncbi:MAG: histidine--tRNA ligase [Gaiellales bacterium]